MEKSFGVMDRCGVVCFLCDGEKVIGFVESGCFPNAFDGEFPFEKKPFDVFNSFLVRDTVGDEFVEMVGVEFDFSEKNFFVLNKLPRVVGDVGLTWSGCVAVLALEFSFGDGLKNVLVENVIMGVNIGST